MCRFLGVFFSDYVGKLDFRINPNTIPVLKRTPVQINVEALKVAGTRGGTLQLILIEKDAANRTNEFVLS